MSLRFPLLTKILLWFFLNLLVLGAVLLVLLNLQFRFAPDSLLFTATGGRLQEVALAIATDLREATPEERQRVLQRYSAAYQVEFLLYANTGENLAGGGAPLPPDVWQRLTERPRRPEALAPEAIPRNVPLRLPRQIIFKVSTANPTRYWAGVRVPVLEPGQTLPIRATLLVASDSISGRGLFFDPKPWLSIALAVFVISLLLWLPFVRSLTGTIRQMTQAAEQIAEEHFDVRVDERRTDELGRLGKAINHLAARLSGFVGGQKRFLGDISHELNSPLGRMQLALSILEERVDPAQRSYVEDAQEEVRLMAQLVNELLAYAKTGMKTAELRLTSVPLRPLVEKVSAREAAGHKLELQIADTVVVYAQPELLARALANVIRNAVRYAAADGPITIAASRQDKQVKLCVADHGPGVPAEALAKLFDPFYRPEPDRARQTGGAGLGLAIVKTCIEACQGTVTARNRTPRGLEIVILLAAAD